MNEFFERQFRLKEHGTDARTEVLAGITTFMTMAYILAVNPGMLAMTGMDQNAVFTATALSAALATLIMAFYANYPFALASGMGLNAYFTFSVVLGMGQTWQFALTAVLIEGLVFILLTLTKVREMIVNSIPLSLKNAVSVGIGFFIAFIGLHGAGVVKTGEGIPLDLGNLLTPSVAVFVIGLILISVMLVKKIRGAILIGIILCTIVGIPLGVTQLPDSGHLVSLPPSLSPILFQFEFHNVFTFNMLVVFFSFLFVDLFDTVGTLVGVASKANMLDEDGKLPRVRQALFADAVGTVAGACLGTSTVTTYVESAAGVAEGGRTGLTALTTAVLFLLALFFAPIFAMIPSAATAPALVVVGVFMMSPVLKLDLEDFTEAVPAFLAIVMMPLSYSIANGIVFGIISYAALKLLTGRGKEASPMVYILAMLFLIRYLLPLFVQ